MNDKVAILSPVSRSSFENRLGDLFQQLDKLLADSFEIVWCRAYISDVANQLESLKQHQLYREILSKSAFSYIEQAPLDGSKITLLLSIVEKGELKKEGEAGKMAVSCNGMTYLYHSVRLTEEESATLGAKEQTELCFQKHIQWLNQKGLSLKDNCMRTWLYVRDIDRNYADVMKGRNAVFAEEGLTTDTHFIASTGIEGNDKHASTVIAIDFFSVCGDQDLCVKYLQAPEYLNPTYQYGVAFERGTSYHVDDQHHLLLSGTASINKEGECIFVGDVERQAERMLLNMEKLLNADGSSLADMRYLLVYLRDLSDYNVINHYISQTFTNIPVLFLQAPVCRPAWLIEAEGEAVCQKV